MLSIKSLTVVIVVSAVYLWTSSQSPTPPNAPMDIFTGKSSYAYQSIGYNDFESAKNYTRHNVYRGIQNVHSYISSKIEELQTANYFDFTLLCRKYVMMVYNAHKIIRNGTAPIFTMISTCKYFAYILYRGTRTVFTIALSSIKLPNFVFSLSSIKLPNFALILSSIKLPNFVFAEIPTCSEIIALIVNLTYVPLIISTLYLIQNPRVQSPRIITKYTTRISFKKLAQLYANREKWKRLHLNSSIRKKVIVAILEDDRTRSAVKVTKLRELCGSLTYDVEDDKSDKNWTGK